ncbi:MAG: cell wall hydrolase [Ruminococcus sp.]|nr:cell wall hydrolase [Ruminococcus sp.]
MKRRIRSLFGLGLLLTLTMTVPAYAADDRDKNKNVSEEMSESGIEIEENGQDAVEQKAPVSFNVGKKQELENVLQINRSLMDSGWKLYNGNPVYFDSEGQMVNSGMNGWLNHLGSSFWMKNGIRQIGWQKIEGNWYYLDPKSNGPATGWFTVDGETYYADQNGVMKTGWMKLTGMTMYYDPETYEAATGMKEINGKYYLFNKDGVLLSTAGTPIYNGKKYWIQKNGTLGSGWLYLGNWKMYFDPETMQAKTGMADINGKRYLFNSDGVMQNFAGTTIINGKKYWFSTDDASLKTGWLTLAGMKLYFDPKTYVAATGWKTIDGKKYYFDENGVLKEGFITKGGYTYYLKSDGTYATGTPVINGEKYGFDSKGRQILGWYTLGSWKFYFDPDNGGAAVTTYIKLDDVTYYFNSDGTLASVSNNFYINLKDPANGKTYTLESQFESDPVVDDETLLAAVTYTESGNHELACQVATALVILNRVESKSYPDTLKYVVYQKSQFEVARSGALTKILKAYESNDQTQLKWLKTTEEAVAIALEIMGAYKTDGIERTIDDVTLPNGKTDFDYLGFMTPAAFERCNLDPVATEAFQIDDVMFFTKWITKS